MGIYDREYYRRDGPNFLGAFHLRGQVCKWLIIVNIAIFVVQLLTRVGGVRDWDGNFVSWLPGPFTDALLLDVQKVFEGQVWRLLTYAFLHDPGTGFPPPSGWYWHIVFNMWFLWMFGSDLEQLYGPREFLSFYLGAAFAGGVAFLAAGAITGQRQCIGASGAVTAVMVLSALHFPTRTILLFFVLPVPIWAFVIFQVVQDTFLFLGQTASRVAVTVHLGGAAFAFLYYKLHWRLSSILPRLRAWRLARSRPRLRVYREDDRHGEPVHAAPPGAAAAAGSDLDEQLEAKLDAVLEKVARSGQASLTESERAILLRASEIYKRRRS